MAASAVTAPAVDVPMDTHDNQADLPRPYKCPMCEKAFHRLEHQTRHIRTHTGEKPHACPFPGCAKRFSRSDELTRHSRIHNNPNSRRGNKQNTATAQAAAAAFQGGMYDNAAFQQVNGANHSNLTNYANGANGVSGIAQMHQMSQLNQPVQQNQSSYYNQPVQMKSELPRSPVYQPQTMLPPPPVSQMSQSAPGSQLNSPNVSPPHSYTTFASNPGSYVTRSTSGDISSMQGGYNHGSSNINILATAASQVERENTNASQIPNSQLSLPTNHYYHHNTPYHIGRMPSLSSYHYSSNPASQPMSRSQSDEDQFGQRAAKRSRPGSPRSTAPPSPEFPHESTSPTPDHTPLATPSHSPRIRPQYYHNGMQLPVLNHLTLQNQPPPALAPVEPAADGHQAYVPAQHSGLRISEIMEAGEGAQRKLPLPMVGAKDSGFAKINDLVNPESGQNSGRGSEAGNDLHERN